MMNTRTKKYYIFYSNQCENLNSRYSHNNKYRKMGHDFGIKPTTPYSKTTCYCTVLSNLKNYTTIH